MKATETVRLSLEELNRRGKALKDAIAQVEAIGPPRKVLRYHTPVSKTVTSDELFFECKNGRVTYLDLPGLMRDIEERMKERETNSRDRFSVEDVTQPSGAFRARYTIVRRKAGQNRLRLHGPRKPSLFRLWPRQVRHRTNCRSARGETLAQALKLRPCFAKRFDLLDSQTVVTFWVYPDSFALFERYATISTSAASKSPPAHCPKAIHCGLADGSRSRGQ